MRWRGAMTFAVLLLAASASCDHRDPDRAMWDHWSRLQFHAERSVLLEADLEIARTRDAGTVVLDTRASARVLGRRVEESITRMRLDRGGRTTECLRQSDGDGRRFVFRDDGYTVQRLSRPEDTEMPVERWPVDWSRDFAWPDAPEAAASLKVFEYYGMLLQLQALPLDAPGDEATVFVATADGPRGFRVAVGESRRGVRTVAILETGEQRAVSVLEFRLRVTPIDADSRDEGFLSMEGETEIWVEAGSKTLLEVSGKVPRVPGRVELRLVGIG